MLESLRSMSKEQGDNLIDDKEVIQDISDGARTKLWVRGKSGGYLFIQAGQ